MAHLADERRTSRLVERCTGRLTSVPGRRGRASTDELQRRQVWAKELVYRLLDQIHPGAVMQCERAKPKAPASKNHLPHG